MNIKNLFLASICLFSSLASVNSIRAVDRIKRSNILIAGVDGGGGPRPNFSSSSFEIIRPQSICNDRQGGGGWNIGGVSGSGSGPRPT